MKKHNTPAKKSIALQTQTVRPLGKQELEPVVGGGSGTPQKGIIIVA